MVYLHFLVHMDECILMLGLNSNAVKLFLQTYLYIFSGETLTDNIKGDTLEDNLYSILPDMVKLLQEAGKIDINFMFLVKHQLVLMLCSHMSSHATLMLERRSTSLWTVKWYPDLPAIYPKNSNVKISMYSVCNRLLTNNQILKHILT